MHIIPFEPSHIPLFTRWFNTLPENNLWTEAYVREKTVDDPTFDPDLMLTAVDDGQVVGFMLGSIVENCGWIKAFLVHPNRQRQGIGTALFDAVEEAFAQQGVQGINVGWAPPRYFMPGINLKHMSAIVFLMERGYQTNREARVNQKVNLTDLDLSTDKKEAVLVERGITIRRGRSSDRAGLFTLCEKYDNPGWAVESSIALEKDPAAVFIAERQGDSGSEICGFAAHSIVGPIHFGPMLTSPDLRGLGIGSVLLKRCLADWQHAGETRCEIVWSGPLPFYARVVGATICSAYWVFYKSLVQS